MPVTEPSVGAAWTTWGDGVTSIVNASETARAAVTITYAASITPDAALGGVFRVVATGNLTLADITNGVDGQIVVVKVLASGGIRTITITGATTVTVPSGQWWLGTFYYDATLAGWLLH